MNLNLGSGQRRFGKGWVNADISIRPPDQVPDVCCNGARLPFADGSFDIVCLHHLCEHFGCGEASSMILECKRVLVSGGKLLVFVPDMLALATKWITGKITTQIYMTNVYGAYQGLDGDRHKWGYDNKSLKAYLVSLGFYGVRNYDFSQRIEGADVASDWWILGMEAMA